MLLITTTLPGAACSVKDPSRLVNTPFLEFLTDTDAPSSGVPEVSVITPL
jgi:hypothetical protein